MSVEPPLTGSITRSVRRESASVRSPIDLAKSFIAAGLTSQYAKIHSGSRTSSRIAVDAVGLGEDEALLLEDALRQLAREVLGRADLVFLVEAVEGVRCDGAVGRRRALAARRGAAPARRRPALGDGLGRGLLAGPCRARLRLPGDRPDRGAEAGRARRAAASTATAFTGVAFSAGAPVFAVATRLRAAAALLGLRLPGRWPLRDRLGRRPGAADRGGAEAPRVVRGDSSLAAAGWPPTSRRRSPSRSSSRPTKRARPLSDRRPAAPATRLCRRAARQSPSSPPSSCCWP